MNDVINREYAIDAVLGIGHTAKLNDGDTVVRMSAVNYVLRNLPSAQPEPCEDAVSRNAIIQKLNTMDRYVSEELVLCDTDKKFPKNEVFIVDDVYEEIVENLPSAQPERLTDDDFETIRIHLNAYKEKLCNQQRWKEAGEYQRIIDRFMSFASVQADIIHCGECRHRDPEDHKCDCGHDILWQLPRQDEWYCADAERRTDEL